MSDELPKPSPNSLTTLLKNLLLIGTSGITLITFLFLLAIWRSGNGLIRAVDALFDPPPPTAEVNIPTAIVHQVQGVSELTTAVFIMEAVVPTSAERKFGEIVVGSTKLLYVAYGEVRAGVDLSNLSADDIKVEKDTIYIYLPAPEILDSKIDVHRSSVYDYNRGFLNLGPDVAPLLQTSAQRQTLEKIVTTACHKGVLEEANDRAKLAITQLLTTAGYEKVEVKTTAPLGCAALTP